MFRLKKRVEKLEKKAAQGECEHILLSGICITRKRGSIQVKAGCITCDKEFIQIIQDEREAAKAYRFFEGQLHA